MLHVDGDGGRIGLPVALAADHDEEERILELRLYFSSWPLTGRHANRPPLLQPDAGLHAPDVVGDYQRALAAGDAAAAVATFEPDGYVREPGGAARIHRGRGGLRAYYDRMFSYGGGVAQEDCAIVGDEHTCALEYNVVRWGKAQLLPQAGMAAYVLGTGGKLTAVRVYDDVGPPRGQLHLHLIPGL